MKILFPTYIIKKQARYAMRGNFFKVLSAVFIPALIVLGACAVITGVTPGAWESLSLIVRGGFESPEARAEYLVTVMNNYMFTYMAVAVLFSFLNVGCTRIMLDLVRGKKTTIKTLFTYYNKWYVALVWPLVSLLYNFAAVKLIDALSMKGVSADLITAAAWLTDALIMIASLKLVFIDMALADNDCKSFSAALKSAWSTTGFYNIVNVIILEVSFLGWFLLAALTGGLILIYAVPYYCLSVVSLYEINLRARAQQLQQNTAETEE